MEVLLLVFFLVPLASTTCETTIRINALDGTDTDTCLGLSPSHTSCQSLRYVLLAINGTSNVAVYIDTNVTLQGTIVLENMANITISGSASIEQFHRMKTIACSNDEFSGTLLFTNVTNITISDLELDTCGGYDDAAAIIFNRSSIIHLVNTTIKESHLTGIAFINCYAEVVLDKVHFYYNTAYTNIGRNVLSLPAGASIEMTTNFTLKECVFKGNKAAKTNFPSSTKNIIYQYGTGLGGGLGIFIAGNCTNSISRTRFSKNSAKWGMYVHFQDFSADNSIFVQDSVFDSNDAEIAGGGVYIIYMINKTFPIVSFFVT